MTTSTSFSKEQRALLNEMIFNRIEEIDLEIEVLRIDRGRLREVQAIIGPSYNPEDVAFNSRCY